MSEIFIIGAGPAGLVAAINLKREGYDVIVWEKEKTIGGPPGWHPSVHGTPVSDRTWDYTGIDCSSCFLDMRSVPQHAVIGGKQLDDPAPFYQQIGLGKELNIAMVERGNREPSLDSFLFRIAEKEGVKFEFSKALTMDNLKELPPNSILATGLGPKVYEIMDIPFTDYKGYWSYLEIKPEDASIGSYFGAYTNEYGYSSYANGIWYILLFSRKEIPKEGLEEFNQVVKRIEGKEIKEWKTFFGRTPKSPKLIHNKMILTGTLAGFIEPALGYGITGALISGKIAALAVTDRAKGEQEFIRFTAGIPDFILKKKQPGYAPKVKMGEIWFDI